MDNFMFKQLIRDQNTVEEFCSYTEIFVCNNGDIESSFDVQLPRNEFEDWLKRQGKFAPKTLLSGTEVQGSLRLLIQRDSNPQSFEPRNISLETSMYEQMIASLNLSHRQLQSSYTFGPFFWSVTCKDDKQGHLQVIFRNISGSKAGHCQGWELSLAYMPDTGSTTGFFRGTSKSIMNQCLDVLKSSASKAIHPLLLPAILLGAEMGSISNSGLEYSRGWLETTEETMEKYPGSQTPHALNSMEISLLGIHRKVIQRHPQAWMEVVKNFERTLEESSTLRREESPELRRERLNARQVLGGSIAFYKSRLEGLNADVTVTLTRIEALRSVIQNLLAVALSDRQQARDEKKHDESVRYSHNQQVFSVLGVLFLPGTFFAAIFSTSFFDFQAPQGASVISQHFWIFWAITIPTMILLAMILYIRHICH